MSKTNITADSLRTISDSADLNVDWILERCLAAAEGGDTYYYHNDTLNRKQIDFIRSKGFNVEYFEGQPGQDCTYKIKW